MIKFSRYYQIIVGFLFCCAITYSQDNWKTYDFPYLGVSFQFTPVEDIENEDLECLFQGEFNQDEELEILIGIIQKESENYDLESWFEPFKTQGEFPDITFSDYPELKNRSKDIVYFTDEESYTMRCFVPLKAGYFFTVQIDGYHETKKTDLKYIRKVLDGIKLKVPKDIHQNNNAEINSKQKGSLSKKLKSTYVKSSLKFTDFVPKVKFDTKGKAWMISSEKGKEVNLSKLDENLKFVQNIPLDKDKYYMDFAFDNQYVYLAYIYDKYEINGQESPKRFWSKLGVMKYSLSGSKLWDTEIMPEIFINNSGDKGALWWAVLGVMDSELIVYYPVNGKFDDGITHQGDAYTILGKDGKVNKDKGSDWNVSHSFDQKIVVADNHAFMYALGDAYPRGIRLQVMEDKNGINYKAGSNIFPFKGKVGDNYVGDTKLSNAIVDDQYAYIVLSTEEGVTGHNSGRFDTENDLILLVCDKDGKKVLEKNITNTPGVDEDWIVSIHFVNENIMIIWYEFTKDTDGFPINLNAHYMLINKKGTIIEPATPLQSETRNIFKNWEEKGFDLFEDDVDEFIGAASFGKKVLLVRGMTLYLSDFMELLEINP